jgi:hypothetical protein
VTAKLVANMAARPAVAASFKTMLIYGVFDQELFDYIMFLKGVVDYNFRT